MELNKLNKYAGIFDFLATQDLEDEESFEDEEDDDKNIPMNDVSEILWRDQES
jgi:hypothetical protein